MEIEKRHGAKLTCENCEEIVTKLIRPKQHEDWCCLACFIKIYLPYLSEALWNGEKITGLTKSELKQLEKSLPDMIPSVDPNTQDNIINIYESA